MIGHDKEGKRLCCQPQDLPGRIGSIKDKGRANNL